MQLLSILSLNFQLLAIPSLNLRSYGLACPGHCLEMKSGKMQSSVTNLSISAKQPAGILIGIELNLYLNLESIAILTILSLLIHEYEVSFYLFQSSLIFF